jgi:hypothetical protein
VFHAAVTRLVLAAALVALLAAGCGSADNEPSLAEAAAKTEDTGSSRFAVEGTEIDGTERVEVTCTGEADYRAKAARVSCTYGADGRLELVSIGTDTYFRGNIAGFGIGDEKWLKTTDDESLGEQLSPRALLAMLRGASQTEERVGEEQVRGEDTVRYRLEVDCEQAELTDCPATTARVDVWIGDDDLVRRIAVDEGSSPFSFEFYDFGAEVDIQPPPPDAIESPEDLFPGPAPCSAGFGDPISPERAMSTFRRHGLTIPDDEPECDDGQSAFGNTAAALEDEGQLYCVVREVSPEGAPTSVARRGADGADAAWRLENLECALLADSADSESKLERVDAAFADLQRQIRK